jgi:hypothetical protein
VMTGVEGKKWQLEPVPEAGRLGEHGVE